MNEVLRRVVLVFMLCVSVGLLRTAQFGDYYEISPITDSSLRDRIKRKMFMEKSERQFLLSLPFQDLLAKRMDTPLQLVDGPEWEQFFSKLEASFNNNNVPKEWKPGAEEFIFDLSRLWLSDKQSPQLSSLDRSLFNDLGAVVPIALRSKPDSVFSVRLTTIAPSDYDGFNGFSMQTPPLALLYPNCIPAIAAAVLGLLFYLFFPWAKPAEDSVHTKRWQVMMLDFAAFWMFFPFFALGSFMAGPIPAGFHGGWIVTSVLWLMCIGGLFLYKQGVFYALFFMKTEEDGLRIRSFQGEFKLPYSDIEKVQGAVLKNPRWLVRLLWLGAIFGRGSQSLLAGGQALMLGSTNYPGLGFTLKRGGTIYLWSSGHSETMATYKHIDSFKAGLEKAGVPMEEKAVEVYGLGTEPRFDKAVEIDAPFIARRPLLLLLLAPVVSTALMYLLAGTVL